MIVDGLFSLLSTAPAVMALLADPNDDNGMVRLYPVMMPLNQEIFPAATLQKMGGITEYTLDSTRFRTTRIQVDAFARSFLDADNVLEAIRGVLEGYVGTLPNGLRVLFAAQSIETDQFETDTRIYRSLCEYEIEFC